MSEADYRTIPEGGALERLDSGLIVIRRRKHEWSPRLEELQGKDLAEFTGKISGSKFIRDWTLTRQVEWLREQLKLLAWAPHSPMQNHTVDLGEVVGYSKGRAVTKIRIELSSRFVHAYPVED